MDALLTPGETLTAEGEKRRDANTLSTFETSKYKIVAT
jgi:hypothetical protein